MDDRIIKLSPKTPNAITTNNPEQLILTIYPNPFKECATIAISNSATTLEEFELKIYNLLGDELRSIKLTNNTSTAFQKGNLSQGIYVYRLYSNSKIVRNGKIVVN
jgi:hypothetical protein